MPMHDDQLSISLDLVTALIRAQFPQWADHPISEVRTAGTVNAIFRVGESWAARFPLREDDPRTVRVWLTREAAAMAELAAVSPVPVPEPVTLGEPGEGYPLPWSVQTWLPGADGWTNDPSGSDAFADDLAHFIAALRAAPTHGRVFDGQNRGGDLRRHDSWMQTCLRESVGLLDVPVLAGMWQKFRELPREGADVMSHQDLIPGNVLVADGRLVGVLDGGGFGPADPALDLVAAWHLLDDGPRRRLRDALGCDDLEWRCGMAWAFEQAMGLVWYYRVSNPPMSRLGVRTLRRLTSAH